VSHRRAVLFGAGVFTFVVWAGLATAPAALQDRSAAPQDKGGEDHTGPYDLVKGWFKPIEPGTTTYVVSVFADTPDRLLMVATGATPGDRVGTFDPKVTGARLDHLMVVVDGSGKVVEEWRQWFPMWGNPHAARINPYDPERHVWFIDRESHQISEFTRDGKSMVRTFGEKGVAAADETHFGRPAEIAWLPDGTFFVADGYQNRRVVKFDRNGRYVTSWGSQGSAPGQFGGIVHCVAVDAQRRVYVADAGNRRIQVFDENGKFLEQWPDITSPTHILVTQDQSVWVSDLQTNRILKYNTAGKLMTYWGVGGTQEGTFQGAHDFHVDSAGNLYINQALAHRVDKFVPKRGADPARLVGQPFK
jgi:DNA-binding beta-propeller fold protein YncE